MLTQLHSPWIWLVPYHGPSKIPRAPWSSWFESLECSPDVLGSQDSAFLPLGRDPRLAATQSTAEGCEFVVKPLQTQRDINAPHLSFQGAVFCHFAEISSPWLSCCGPERWLSPTQRSSLDSAELSPSAQLPAEAGSLLPARYLSPS